tara:strand:+ start:10157 stop:11452 length:1296 start_codon:yes stop_codon:yes gene_type:complete
MKKLFINCIKKFFKHIVAAFFIPILFFVSLYIYFFHDNSRKRIVWGSTPLINNYYWSKAMKEGGYKSETYVSQIYSKINQSSDFDKILDQKYKFLSSFLKPYFVFLFSLFKYDIFFTSFDGFFLQETPINFLQAFYLKLARKKIVVIPYGGDAYVSRNIKSLSLAHALIYSYPLTSRSQASVLKKVNYWTKNADAIIPGFMFGDGIGRWDTLTPSPLSLDLKFWEKSNKKQLSNGKDSEVVIAHAPNHRGCKGTEFIIKAIENLKKNGYKIKFLLIEKKQNFEVQKMLNQEVDILVEQLIFTGFGLNGIEGMATGITTISNLEDKNYILPLRRWTYFSECPVVSSSPETIFITLKKLIDNPELREELGNCGREYAKKYHSADFARYLFSNIISYVYGEKKSIMDLFHPLNGNYLKDSKKISPPLKNNSLVD